MLINRASVSSSPAAIQFLNLIEAIRVVVRWLHVLWLLLADSDLVLRFDLTQSWSMIWTGEVWSMVIHEIS